MEKSMLIAKYFALVFFTYGLGLLLNKKFYQKLISEYFKSSSSLILGGFLALIIGLTLVLFHNKWELSWTIIITLFGWGALIKGVLILLYPEEISKHAIKFYKNNQFLDFIAVISILIGILFALFGAFGIGV